jgi:fructose-bisphosphate aldolase, class II
MLVHMGDMLRHAQANGYAVGGYDIVGLEFLEAIVSACERDRAPAILSLAESHFSHYDFDMLMPSVVEAARRSKVPMAVHLDHGASIGTVTRAIRLGCNAVMVDGSHLPFNDNLDLTRDVATLAHGCGVPIEGELGYVPGVEGEDAELHPGEVRMTEPEEAAHFATESGVDCLAVSIGTVHGRMRGTPALDLERMSRIRDAVGVPLVIHGGTGLSDAQYRGLVAAGMTKLNYYTALADAAARSIRTMAEARPDAGYTALLSGVREAISDEVSRMNALLGASGRADEARSACRPWREVIHAIAFNFDGTKDAQWQERALARGVSDLSAIPGVRSVEVGTALKDGMRYSRFWNIRFASEHVVTSYADHPAHVAYADEVFRPAAKDRLSIDYRIEQDD